MSGNFSDSAKLSRRALLRSASALALATFAPAAASAQQSSFAEPFPLSAVRLKPSIFLDAVNADRAYLLSLEPDRLLHNFRKGAGLAPKGELYGGWEARGIAGHTLGHYLSACSLLHAQTGDEEALRRARYIVAELAAAQAARGDGYVGATTVERDGVILDGKIVYEEVRRGEIRSGPFDLNGGWVPLYAWHKVHAGLLDAHAFCGSNEALAVARGMADYLVGVFAGLDDAQVQRVLAAEHGGLNETMAEMFARTGDGRYRALAERLRHRAVLDPLSEERDELAGKHANTQIPKVVGLARMHELTGDAANARAARFFWNAVTQRHSYVVGGNSEREHFAPPGVVAPLLTDRTCEACNTYNMLRLTRHLWRWRQDAAYFDYYERAHLNHVMAHQHPETGMLAYFMPMTPGGRRQFSTPTDSFWCCVGSGMESHAKHGESIYWRRDDTLFVNLFIPSRLEWAERGARIDLDTQFPNGESVEIRVLEAGPRPNYTLAVRLPAWCEAPALALNGGTVTFVRRDGYASIRRRWREGDVLTLDLPMQLRTEAAPDDSRTLSFLSGPLVLAADLGPAEAERTPLTPALHETDPLGAATPIAGAPHVYSLVARPAAVTLRPFYAQYERRTAPYLRQLRDAEWAERVAGAEETQRRRSALNARTVDMIQLGETESERRHNYRANHADLLSYEGVAGRQAWWGVGNFFEFEFAIEPGPLALHALYWGEEIDKNFEILVDGRRLAHERRPGPPQRAFVEREYALSCAVTHGKSRIGVRFETRGSDAPVYQVRIVRPA